MLNGPQLRSQHLLICWPIPPDCVVRRTVKLSRGQQSFFNAEKDGALFSPTIEDSFRENEIASLSESERIGTVHCLDSIFH